MVVGLGSKRDRPHLYLGGRKFTTKLAEIGHARSHPALLERVQERQQVRLFGLGEACIQDQIEELDAIV